MTSRTLLRALARAGLELAGPLGTGAGGPRLVARDADGRGWAVTVVAPGEMPRAALRARVDALAHLAHPHVARVAPLLELRDGSAVALQAEVVGPDLATVCRARGPWRPGEVVTLVVPLAQAVAALHAGGVAHGDVSPGNVVLERDGRPVLVDLVCGAWGRELGTPGLSAPERALGAGPAGDVHALGRLGLALLEHDGVDPEHDGIDPEVVATVRSASLGAARLREVLEAAASPDPAVRPDAATLAERAYAACEPEPVRLPDAAVLARLTLRRLAAPPEDATVLRPQLAPSPGRGRHRRGRRLGRGPAVVAAAGMVLAGAVVALEARGGADVGSSSSVVGVGGATTAGSFGRGRTSLPVAAAARLTVRRAEALGARDAVRLASVTVPGSDAADADRRLAAALWRGTPSGGDAVVQEVHLLALDMPGPGRPWRARVLVRARARVTTADGTGALGPTRQDTGVTEGGTAVVLVLDAGPAGWRVSDVEPGPAA